MKRVIWKTPEVRAIPNHGEVFPGGVIDHLPPEMVQNFLRSGDAEYAPSEHPKKSSSRHDQED